MLNWQEHETIRLIQTLTPYTSRYSSLGRFDVRWQKLIRTSSIAAYVSMNSVVNKKPINVVRLFPVPERAAFISTIGFVLSKNGGRRHSACSLRRPRSQRCSRFSGISTSTSFRQPNAVSMYGPLEASLRATPPNYSYSSQVTRQISRPCSEVALSSAFGKLTSSNSCNKAVRTSGCAFSVSSNKTTALGQAESALVSWPPCSWPT